MSILSHPLTVADLERERACRDERLELIEGEIVVTPSPSMWHQLISHRLAVVLDRAVVETNLGIVLAAPLDVVFDEFTVLQPDLFVLFHQREQWLESSTVERAPDFAIEILSPSTSARDRGVRRDLYARFGVQEYWLIDPDARSVTACSDMHNGRYRTEVTTNDVTVSASIAGHSVDLAALFGPIQGG